MTTTNNASTPPATPSEGLRDRKKAHHRNLLIQATGEAVMNHGVRGTTIDRIQQISGLSRGMISLHFGSKENLLLALIEQLAEEYTENWRAAVDHGGEDPAGRLLALMRADFAPAVLNRRNMVIWFAFRAETPANPQYRPFVDSRESNFRQALTETCRTLSGPGNEALADQRAYALTALLEGMWADFHLNPDSFNRIEALETCVLVASRLFPEHSF
ncbi:MAG: TetR family transcriptional regulator C-terminal domain-containing protein [Pararhodobacter sp.]|nr:TetR family transcriptional regulator C-terminal domain-containing protein [Pararhodobacter sp.]